MKLVPIVTTAALAIWLPFQSIADEQCASIEDSGDRLRCYDDAASRADAPKADSSWVVKVDTSKLDDTNTVLLRTTSTEQFPGRFGQFEYGNLIIRCMENTTSVFAIWGGHFMSSIQGRGRVEYRIDNEPASAVNMVESNDNMALGLWSGRKAIPFAKKLFGASQLYIRATPFNESAVEMTFEIEGIEGEIEPLREACGW